MTFANFFADYWWLIFPIFWMVMYALRCTRHDRNAYLEYENARLRSELKK